MHRFVIDTHIHLFDPRRPQGIPWPTKDDVAIYHPALPDRYKGVTQGAGIVGAIAVECSPWLEDNQWVLDIVAHNPVILGTVGNLEPGKPHFAENLEHFHKDPLFLGIRCGNLWGRNLAEQISNPDFVADIKLLARAGLAMDTANPDARLISASLKLKDMVPELRIVVDHLPQFEPPDAATRAAVRADLRELASRPQVFAKISEVLRKVSGRVPKDLSFYLGKLDDLWNIFGEDRVLYGSDWPNSDIWAPYANVFGVIQEYAEGKTPEARDKLFWKNSLAAYRWLPRETSQAHAVAGA